MKSILKNAAGIAAGAALALGMFSCSVDTASHEHTFATTYSSDATHHWYAATCEHTTEVKNKVEHIFGEWKITTPSTEKTEGVKERECSECGYKAEEKIAKLDHVHTFATAYTSDATHHWYAATCEHTTEVKDKVEHTFGEWKIITPSTEKSEGVKERECSECGYKGTEKVAKLDHVHTFATAYTSDATHHWHAATCEHTTEVKDKVEHTFGEWVSNGDATREADGTKTGKCSECGYEVTVTDKGTKIVIPECKLVAGGTITGAAYTNNFAGVFPAKRNVTLSSFCMGKYEVTQTQYKSIMIGQKVTVDGTEYTLADSPSDCDGANEKYKIDFGKDHANYPVENVTWYDAVYYCNALSAMESLDSCYTITVTEVIDGHITAATVEYNKEKNGYRLPTEAEWEYAARGGDPAKADWNYTFSGADKAEKTSHEDPKNAGLDSVGWYCYNNSTGTTGDVKVTDTADGAGSHEVGQKTANALDIYDMSGNVWEWCYDWYGDIAVETVTDPVGAASGSYRVRRGGCCHGFAKFASVSNRLNNAPKYQSSVLGFRVCRNAN